MPGGVAGILRFAPKIISDAVVRVVAGTGFPGMVQALCTIHLVADFNDIALGVGASRANDGDVGTDALLDEAGPRVDMIALFAFQKRHLPYHRDVYDQGKTEKNTRSPRLKQ